MRRVTEHRTCEVCQRTILTNHAWRRLTPEQREQARAEGIRRCGTTTTCMRCYVHQSKRDEVASNMAAKRERDAQAVAERLEDVAWMVETGECLSGAARRLGITAKGLTKWLEKYAPELQPVLLARDPHDPNAWGRNERWSA